MTNRFVCDSKQAGYPGCGMSYQGLDPHIMSQLPRHLQLAFPCKLHSYACVNLVLM